MTRASGPVSPQAKTRLVGLDAARGLAILLMIQTHAYDGWLTPEARATTAFSVTRFLALLPLPMFLAIAGLNTGLNVQRTAQRSGSRSELRGTLLAQGARVIIAGYGLNLLYALLDGSRGLATWLRIDILHCIGICIALLALCLGRAPTPETPVDARAFARASFALGALALLACPPLSRLALECTSPLGRFMLAPWFEVPGLSTMPVIPLVFFAALPAAIGARVSWDALSGKRGIALTGCVCLSALVLAYVANPWLRAHGMPPARTNPGIWINALDLSARAGGVLGLTFFLTHSRRRDVPVLSLLGRHSLLIYGLHLPFCYGRLAGPLKRSATFAEASLGLLALVGLCGLVAFLREGHARRAIRAVSLDA